MLDLSVLLGNKHGGIRSCVFDLIDKGKIDLIWLAASIDCSQVYRLREWARAHHNKAWQHLSIPLSCFSWYQQGSKVMSVDPLPLSTGGEVKSPMANVGFKAQGWCPICRVIHPPNPCATTAGHLNEYWSVDWWFFLARCRKRSLKPRR